MGRPRPKTVPVTRPATTPDVRSCLPLAFSTYASVAQNTAPRSVAYAVLRPMIPSSSCACLKCCRESVGGRRCGPKGEGARDQTSSKEWAREHPSFAQPCCVVTAYLEGHVRLLCARCKARKPDQRRVGHGVGNNIVLVGGLPGVTGTGVVVGLLGHRAAHVHLRWLFLVIGRLCRAAALCLGEGGPVCRPVPPRPGPACRLRARHAHAQSVRAVASAGRGEVERSPRAGP
jgi:hypothetical protein